MKIIIDECLPKRVTGFFKGHEVWTVPQIGLGGYSDTDLLQELDKRAIDIFVTMDGNIEYQQQFQNRVFATLIIRSVSNRFSDLLHLQDELLKVLENTSSGQIFHIPTKSF